MKSQRFTLVSLPEHLDADIDLFICCASYEDRCRSVAEHLPRNRIRRALVAETEHRQRYISKNGDVIREIFSGSRIDVTLDTADPVTTADALGHGLRRAELANDASILIDVTTFTHEALLILVKLLSLHGSPEQKMYFIYAVASEYSIGDSDPDKWLSKGVSDIRSVLGFAGIMQPARRQHLIVLVGFEHERAAELIKTYEPGLISLGHGRRGTATQEKHEIANRLFHDLVNAMASTYGDVRKFEFSANDPLDAQAAIERQIKGARQYNTVVAPMNTKLSTLGAVLAAQKDESIQICYARANHYNYKGYSVPGLDCYLLELPELFVKTDKIRDNLDVNRES